MQASYNSIANLHSPEPLCGRDRVATACVLEAINRAPDDFRFWPISWQNYVFFESLQETADIP
jgi:hypothetical protein